MFAFWLGDLQLHGAGNTNFNLKNPIEGLESPEYRIGSYDRPGEDGGVVSSALYGMRQVTLVGRVSGSNAAQFSDNRFLLSRACAIQCDSKGYPVLTRCQVTTLAGNTFYFYAQVGKPQFSMDNINWSNFLIPLIAPDPQIFGETGVDTGNIIRPQPTGITWPVTWPLIFGGLVGGSTTVNSNGSLFSWPIIRLDGPLTNPYIQNTTTGKLMQLTYTLSAGSFIKIYMGDTPDGPGKRIMLNDVDNLIAAKTSDSEWWAIEPGDNVIAFSSSTAGDTGTFRLTFNPGYVGI